MFIVRRGVKADVRAEGRIQSASLVFVVGAFGILKDLGQGLLFEV